MTLPRILITWLALLGVWAAGAAAQGTSCDPACPEDCVPGTNVPDPRNCAQYYTCLEDCTPSDPAFECDEGHKFDVVTAQCQLDGGGVTCGYCVPPCRYTCRGDTVMAVDREDCHGAWLCATDPPLHAHCGDLYFNGTECQDDPTQCCDPCDVVCEAAFTEVMDPTSCRHFYYCAEAGFPLPGDRYECGEGEVFHSGHCTAEDSAQCYEPCAGTH